MMTQQVYTYEEAYGESLKYFNNVDLPAKIFVDKYALRDNDGNLLEKTPADMHRRLAKEFARIEAKKFKKPYTEDEIFNWFDKFKCIIPQGSPLSGIGNNRQYVSLSNCTVAESPLDSYSSILDTDQQLVNLSKRRCGVGISLDNLRPTDSPTQNSARTSTGVKTWMERYSNSTREVGQNSRRGALMLTLNVHHPDIERFITAKNDNVSVTGANISTKLTDEFMRAVQNNEDYELRFPVNTDCPTISKMVSAKKIWDMIIHNAWERAEPGILMWDNILRESPADCYALLGFETICTNPCCFSESHTTWVITKEGIKNIKEITPSDLVWVDDEKAWRKTSGYFKAGVAQTYKVSLKNGTELYITDNHKLQGIKSVRQGTKVVNVPGDLIPLSHLKVGDKLLVSHNKPVDINFGSLGTKEEGYIMGWLSGDGCLSYHDDRQDYPNTILTFWSGEYDVAYKLEKMMQNMGYEIGLTSNTVNQTLRLSSGVYTRDFINKYEYNIWKFKSEHGFNPFLFKASKDFVIGYLSSYFAADGTVECCEINKSYNIQLASINKERLEEVKQLLLMFGIKCSVLLARASGTSVFNGKEFPTQDCWRLTITGTDNIKKFSEQIGIINDRKQEKLNDIINRESLKESKCTNYTTITNIEPYKVEEVGCIEVEDLHRFVANGVCSGNSEIPLSELDSCRLMALNLFCCVKNPFKKNASFDWKLLSKFAGRLQRLMDDLVDLELECIDRIINKIKSDPEPEDAKRSELELWMKLRRNCENGRRTGSGITALGDTMAALGIKYGSDESIQFTQEVYKYLKLGAYRASVEMAEEIGAFPVWDAKLEKNNPFLLRIKDEDPALYNKMQKVGRRNIALLTTAPTGTISQLACMVVDNIEYFGTTSGIEPNYTWKPYKRRKKGNPGDTHFRVDFVDQSGDSWMEFRVYPAGLSAWMKVNDIEDLIDATDDNCPYLGASAEEINWEKRVELQAAAQKHIDHAISSTINLPSDVKEEEVSRIYQKAWELGLKGVTVYRDGCRTGVLVKDEPKTDKIPKTDCPKRPKKMPCEIHHTTIKGQSYLVVVGLLNDEPYEVFASENGTIDKKYKEGFVVKQRRGHYQLISGDNVVVNSLTVNYNEYEEAMTRMVSTSLRHGANIAFVVHQLEKSHGDIQSFNKAIARILKKYIPDGTKVSGESCEQCGADLQRKEGCVSCPSCGWSKC